jgi:hypothetical protein
LWLAPPNAWHSVKTNGRDERGVAEWCGGTWLQDMMTLSLRCEDLDDFFEVSVSAQREECVTVTSGDESKRVLEGWMFEGYRLARAPQHLGLMANRSIPSGINASRNNTVLFISELVQRVTS